MSIPLRRYRFYRFTTPNVPDAARVSREHVGLLLSHVHCMVEADAARLLVSELVTNAHQHTASPVVSVAAGRSRRQLSNADAGAGLCRHSG